jgi:hypothetical protein
MYLYITPVTLSIIISSNPIIVSDYVCNIVLCLHFHVDELPHVGVNTAYSVYEICVDLCDHAFMIFHKMFIKSNELYASFFACVSLMTTDICH